MKLRVVRQARPRKRKPNRATPNSNLRRIQARFRGGVLYLLEDVELPDGLVVDVSIHVRPKPRASLSAVDELARDYFSA